MAEKLTKTVLKEELMRRIDWYENRFGFNKEISYYDIYDDNNIALHLGRYRAYADILWQIENDCFKGGFVC